MKHVKRGPRKIGTNASASAVVTAFMPVLQEAIKNLKLELKLEDDRIYVSINPDEQVSISPSAATVGTFEHLKKTGSTATVQEAGRYANVQELVKIITDLTKGIAANSCRNGKRVLTAGKKHIAAINASNAARKSKRVIDLDANKKSKRGPYRKNRALNSSRGPQAFNKTRKRLNASVVGAVESVTADMQLIQDACLFYSYGNETLPAGMYVAYYDQDDVKYVAVLVTEENSYSFATGEELATNITAEESVGGYSELDYADDVISEM